MTGAMELKNNPWIACQAATFRLILEPRRLRFKIYFWLDKEIDSSQKLHENIWFSLYIRIYKDI